MKMPKMVINGCLPSLNLIIDAITNKLLTHL